MRETGKCMLRARGRSGPRVWVGSLGARIGHVVGHSALRAWSLAGRRDREKGGEEQAVWRGGADSEDPGTWGWEEG